MTFAARKVAAITLVLLAGSARATTLQWPGPVGTPCNLLSLQGCVNVAANGDIIQVRTNSPINENITVSKSLTLTNRAGFSPSFAPFKLVFLENTGTQANTIVFENFTMNQAGVRARQSGTTGLFNVTIRNLVANGTYDNYAGPQIGIETSQPGLVGPVQFDISNNVLTIPANSQSFGATSISVQGGTASTMTGTVRGNRINHFDGGQQGAIELYNLTANPLDVDVLANEIRGSDYNCGVLLFQFGDGTSDVRFLNNLVAGQHNTAGAPGAYVINISDGNATFNIANNTAADGDNGIHVGGRDDLGASWSGTVANNIIARMSNGGISLDQPTLTSGTVTNDHNLVFNTAWDGYTPGPGTLTTDPRFVSASDYRLSDPSPARNTGNNTRVPGDLTTDLSGNPRIVGTVDMGAYESTSPVPWLGPACLSGVPPGDWPGCGVTISSAPGGQLSSRIVSDNAGGAFVAYIDQVSNSRTILQHVDAAGGVVAGWPASGVPLNMPSGSTGAGVIPDGNGGALVTWSDARNDPTNLYWDIFAQRITSAGTIAPGWPANGLLLHATTQTSDEVLAGIVSDGFGGAFIAYRSDVLGNRLAHVLSSGSSDPVWPAGGSPIAGGSMRIVSDGVGGTYLALGSGTELRLMRFTGTGVPAGGWTATGLLLASDNFPSDRFDLDLQADGSGASLVWRTTAQSVSMTIVNPAGAQAAGYPQLLSSNGNPKTLLNVANGGDAGGAVACWREDLPNPAGFTVAIHRRSATGTLPAGWSAAGASVIPDGTELNAFSDCSSGTTFGYRDVVGTTRALRITQAGAVSPGWPAEGALLCGGAFSRIIPQNFAPDGSGGLFATLDRITGTGGFDHLDVFALCVRGDGAASGGYATVLPVGANSQIDLGPATLTFTGVTAAGETRLNLLESGPPPPFGFQIIPSDPVVYYDFTTIATWTPPVDVCIDYNPADLSGPESSLQMMHYDSAAMPPGWVDVTSYVDTVLNVICGTSNSLSPFILVETDPTDVAEQLPSVPQLLANVPNPFNPSTTIRYELPKTETVRLDILDVRGRRVRTLVNDLIGAGRHAVEWNGTDEHGHHVASGVYLYRITTPTFTASRRMVLVK